MFLNKKEITIIAITTLILAFAISLPEISKIFPYIFLSVLIIILANVLAKKITGFYLDSDIEIKLWEIKRFGFKPTRKFKKPFPVGGFFPVISKIIFFPINSFIWMACLIFEVKPKISRAAKKHHLYSFSEITEYHLALISATGIFANITLAIIGYFIGFPEFSKLNIYYAFFNMFPLSDLDGNKIFFGSLVLWSFLASIILIGLFCVMFVI